MPSTPRSKFNGGAWTEARFHSFIKSALRSASMRWPPKYEVKKEARIERGIYLCAGFKRRAHKVPASLPPKPGNKLRINNAQVDHIASVVTEDGFTTWDDVINRMFCEKENLQVLCHECHKAKTQEEKESRRAGSKRSSSS